MTYAKLVLDAPIRRRHAASSRAFRAFRAALVPLAAVMLLAAPVAPALAQTLGASVRLLDGGQRDDGTYLAGLEIDLEPGWKTYWRMPGLGGLPPDLDWSGSANVASARLLWPAPQRLEDPYGDAIGYKARVVLPVEIVPQDRAAPVDLAVTGLIGVCERVCVPLDVDLHAILDADARPGRLARFVAAVPRPATPEERAAVRTRVSEDGRRLVIETALPLDDLFASGAQVANGLSTPVKGGYAIDLRADASADAPVTLTALVGSEGFDLVLEP